jgi:uncharacterized membrane protein YtjA (UPF0391 family)
MLRFAIVFLILALVAGVLGFTGIAGQSMEFAKILFFVFLVLFLLGLVFNLSTGKRSGIVQCALTRQTRETEPPLRAPRAGSCRGLGCRPR